MSLTLTGSTGSHGSAKNGRSDADEQKIIDRWLLWGAMLTGTFVLAIPGVLMLVYAVYLTRKARAHGRAIRPDIITIIGIVCIVDAAINWLMWGIDFFPAHDTELGKTLFNGFGRLWDGAYYLGYNSTAAGGTGISSEKAFEFCGTLMMYPMRIVAGWGFLKMKRWGFQYMMVASPRS